MSGANWLQFVVLIVLLAISIPILGGYLAKVFGGGQRARRPRVPPGRAARLPHRPHRPGPRAAVDRLHVLGARVQPGRARCSSTGCNGSRPSCRSTRRTRPRIGEALSFNTAVSFVTNTNWQSYYPETTVSHFTNMAGLAVQNWVSPAVGLAVAIALIRGLTRRRADTIGNFWVDLTRGITRVFLPIGFVVAIVFLTQGVVQNLHGFDVIRTLEGQPAGDPRRPEREPGSHQDARHERRRVLERELGPPVLEPERVHEPACRSTSCR